MFTDRKNNNKIMMLFKGVIIRNSFIIIISTLMSVIGFLTVTRSITKDAFLYTGYSERRQEQIKSQTCFNIMWDRNSFNNYIRRKGVGFSRNISCNHYIKLASPGGRMGNLLFQFAALIGISFEYDSIPIVDPSFPLLKYFDLPNVLRMKLSNSSICSPQSFGIYYQCSSRSKSDRLINRTIQGFFQSWKYFKNSTDIIRPILKIRSSYMHPARNFLNIHHKAGFKNICIHVRRADMTTDSNQRAGYAVAPISFIYKAINFCKTNFKKAIFFVLSDDINWCRKNIRLDVKFSNLKDPGSDFALMTLCDHVVVTSGTFGWWGAWLSNGTAVYYNDYPRPGSLIDGPFSREDYYPPNWIGLL